MCSSSCSLEKKKHLFLFHRVSKAAVLPDHTRCLWCSDAHSETSFSGANSDRSVRFHLHVSWNCWETLHEDIGGCRFGSRPVQTFVLRTDRLDSFGLEGLSSNMEEKRGAPTVRAPSGHTNRKNKVKSLLCFGRQRLANSSFIAHRPWSVSLQESTSENPTFMFQIQTARRCQPPWRRQRDSKTQKKAGKHHVVNSNSCELQERCFKLQVVKVEVKGRMKRSGCCSERLHSSPNSEKASAGLRVSLNTSMG